MSYKTINTKYITIFFGAFLIGGLLHVALYGIDFFDCISQMYYSAMALVWAVTIQKRVSDRRIRNRLLVTVSLMLLMFMLQICSYKLLGEELNPLRYSWYGYYIPVILAPFFMYRIAILVGTGEDTHPKVNPVITVFSVILPLMVMTNDIHQFVFKFPGGTKQGYYANSHGIGFYLIYVWVTVLFIWSLAIIVGKCRVMAAQKQAWLPVALALIGGIAEIIHMLGILKISGKSIWNMGEIFFFWVFGFEESCIAIGLIPANTGYMRLLDFTDKAIVIADSEGNINYRSRKALDILEDTENVLTFTEEISGGTVSWAVDMSKIYSLNRQIEETTEQIESRNEYLHTQNDLKTEQSKLDARNNLYDNIANILNPQIKEIKKLLETSQDDDFDDKLRHIAVLNAYIKRRSNMELLRADKDILSLKELYTAIAESCEYLKLCKVETMVSLVPDKLLPADIVILVYDFFENVVENHLEKLESVFVTLNFTDNELKLRLLVNGGEILLDENWRKKELEQFGGKISLSSEDSDTLIVFCLKDIVKEKILTEVQNDD